MSLRPGGDNYRAALVWAFLFLWLGLAIAPADRAVWAMENVLVLIVAGLIWTYRREVPLSKTSCTMIFLFLCVHEVGAHYTYPEVPYDAWLEALTGFSLQEHYGLERNHFDRAIHFLFGLLLTQPLRETLLHTTPLHRNWSYVLPVALSMALSSGYEIVEWLAVVAFGGEQGMAFIGAQGDVWDAQKDMALAAVGATLAMAAVAAWERLGTGQLLVARGGRLVGAR